MICNPAVRAFPPGGKADIRQYRLPLTVCLVAAFIRQLRIQSATLMCSTPRINMKSTFDFFQIQDPYFYIVQADCMMMIPLMSTIDKTN